MYMYTCSKLYAYFWFGGTSAERFAKTEEAYQKADEELPGSPSSWPNTAPCMILRGYAFVRPKQCPVKSCGR